MPTLRKAIEEGKLEEFIAEREGDQAPADREAFHATINAMARTSKPIQETSDQDECGD